jgi:hypothetical protein
MHCHTDDVVALLLEQCGCNSAIHTATHCHEYSVHNYGLYDNPPSSAALLCHRNRDRALDRDRKITEQKDA